MRLNQRGGTSLLNLIIFVAVIGAGFWYYPQWKAEQDKEKARGEAINKLTSSYNAEKWEETEKLLDEMKEKYPDDFKKHKSKYFTVYQNMGKKIYDDSISVATKKRGPILKEAVAYFKKAQEWGDAEDFDRVILFDYADALVELKKYKDAKKLVKIGLKPDDDTKKAKKTAERFNILSKRIKRESN